jgi:hypothetical protein
MSAYLQNTKMGRFNPPPRAQPMTMHQGQPMVMGPNGQMYVASRELLLQQQQEQHQRLLQQQAQAMQASQPEHIAKRARMNGPGSGPNALQQQQQQQHMMGQQGQMQLQHPQHQLVRVVSQVRSTREVVLTSERPGTAGHCGASSVCGTAGQLCASGYCCSLTCRCGVASRIASRFRRPGYTYG